MATDLGEPSAGPQGRAPRPRGAHAAAKSGRFRRGASAQADPPPPAQRPAEPSASELNPFDPPPFPPHPIQPRPAQPGPPAAVPPPREIPAVFGPRKALSAPRRAVPPVSAAGLCAVALVAAVVPLSIVQIPDAIAWSLPSQFATGPNALSSLVRAASLALPAMAVAAPLAALAIRRFRAGPVLLAGLLAIGAADALGEGARTVLLIGVDRLLHGLGAGISMAAVTAIVAERRTSTRSLAGWWACTVVWALAAAPVLMRHRVAVGGWRAALQPYPWLAGAALALAALYAVLAEGTARTAMRSTFPAAERALLALLAAPVAGICAITAAVTYRGGRAVVAAAIAAAIALAGLVVIAARASTAGRLAAICAVTGFTIAPAAGTVATLSPPGRPGWETGGAALAAVLCGAALVYIRWPAAASPPATTARAQTANARSASAAGLFVTAAAFAAASQGVPAVTHAGVLALLCVPLAGGLGAAVTAAMRGTGTGGAMVGIVLLLTGVVAGYLAAGAVQWQALQHAQTVAAVRMALVATSARWALLAAGVTAAVALVMAVAPGRLGPARTTDSCAPPVRRAGGTPDRG